MFSYLYQDKYVVRFFSPIEIFPHLGMGLNKCFFWNPTSQEFPKNLDIILYSNGFDNLKLNIL